MKLAAAVPNGRMVPIDGSTPMGDATQALQAIEEFVAALPAKDQPPAPSSVADGLSARELEVLRLVAAGMSNQQIADELVISLFTVNRHASNIYAKIGAANRAEATSYAHRHGIV